MSFLSIVPSPPLPVAVPGEDNASKVIVDLSKGEKEDDLELPPAGDQLDEEDHKIAAAGEVCQVPCPPVYSLGFQEGSRSHPTGCQLIGSFDLPVFLEARGGTKGLLSLSDHHVQRRRGSGWPKGGFADESPLSTSAALAAHFSQASSVRKLGCRELRLIMMFVETFTLQRNQGVGQSQHVPPVVAF